MHFAFLAKLARELGLAHLSMGMSADFETAIAFGATHVRVGSEIFGARGVTLPPPMPKACLRHDEGEDGTPRAAAPTLRRPHAPSGRAKSDGVLVGVMLSCSWPVTRTRCVQRLDRPSCARARRRWPIQIADASPSPSRGRRRSRRTVAQRVKARGDMRDDTIHVTAARTGARCRRASARRRWGGRGCTGRSGASPPSRAAGRSSRRAVSRRPARTLPWQAMVEQTSSSRSLSRLPSGLARPPRAPGRAPGP